MGVMPAAELVIDLDAVADNWRLLDAKHAGSTAGVLKANAYGLGAPQVAAKLVAAGCRHFFTAHLSEALDIRALIPQSSLLRSARNEDLKSVLAVLHGILPGEATIFFENGITPVLCSLHDIALWRDEAARRGEILRAFLHVDTGMARTGLSPRDLALLSDDMSRLDGIDIECLMTHLVSAERPADPVNARQLERFLRIKKMFPLAKSSLANSAGAFLGSTFTADLVRPGAALYGVNPTPGRENPMRAVIRLNARILQIRDVSPGDTVGYNGIWTATRPSRIATVAVGYADGFLRSLGNAATARFEGIETPLVGRVSMDLTTYDVTGAPQAKQGDALELIGPGHDVDALAIEAGTNGYEILTSLGTRYQRRYLGEV